jgi:hypothetical protein
MDVLLPGPQENAPAAAIRARATVVPLEHSADFAVPSGFAVLIQPGGGDRFELVRIEGDRKSPNTS